MSFKQLILQRLNGEPKGNFLVNSAVNSAVNKTPEKFTPKVALIEQNCQGCPYHDTGATPDGKDIIHWCGPWKESNGDTRFWNIAELTACPKGKWGGCF